LNDATGAVLFVGGGGGGGEAGGVTDPPDPFTLNSLLGDPLSKLDNAPVVALPMIAAATVAGVAPGLLWR
jgi:hypothetical protein